MTASNVKTGSVQSDNDPFDDEEKLRDIYKDFEEEDIVLANLGLAEMKRIIEDYDNGKNNMNFSIHGKEQESFPDTGESYEKTKTSNTPPPSCADQE